jgi:hypothetical protein
MRYSVRMHACHFCGAAVEDPRAVYRTSTCPKCGRDLKICLNCKFYSPGSHWDCSETIDEPVRDKERGNFCTFFTFRDGTRKAAAPGGRSGPAGEAKKKLDALFGDEK